MVDLHPFRPRLLDSLKTYDRSRLVHDIGAGITVGIVALPLAMAFAIASGVKPEQGIFTAIIAGFLISRARRLERADRRAGRRLHRHRLRHRRSATGWPTC